MPKHLWLMFALAAFAVAAVLPGSGALAQPPFDGLIGAPLTAARQNSDFFTFFHLEPTGPADAAGVTAFRPSGAAFRTLTRVDVTTDRDGRIRAMRLVLRRSFIDDPQNGVFARDIAKSFLADAPPAADRARLAAFAEDVEKGGGAFAAPGYEPKTAAYDIFTGRLPGPASETLPTTDFTLANIADDGVPALSLALKVR